LAACAAFVIAICSLLIAWPANRVAAQTDTPTETLTPTPAAPQIASTLEPGDGEVTGTGSPNCDSIQNRSPSAIASTPSTPRLARLSGIVAAGVPPASRRRRLGVHERERRCAPLAGGPPAATAE
jgi:hypothetical protein